jgi:hypothetical protein
VNQAAALIAEYERTKILPAALAKAFLSGINSGTVAHLNERDQRTLQIPPLQALVDNQGDGKGQTPDHFIDDEYLGEGNGVQSRLTAIEARKIKADTNQATWRRSARLPATVPLAFWKALLLASRTPAASTQRRLMTWTSP